MNIPVLIWNDELGMCRQEAPGHTAPVAERPFVHNGVVTISHLCLLAQRDQLDDARALAALRSFRAMQVKGESPRHGCLRWYWEETEPVDTNASFFIGLGLQMLYLAEKNRLSEPVRAAIREIMEGLAVWFGRELVEADPRYPNKCMGDLVCSWLAVEILERELSPQLLRTTKEWSDYWRRENWGWGEHMSDIYTMVLLTELSAVLLYCPRLPADLRRTFQSQFENLLAIEDAYSGGPRVPVIRSYAFTETPPVMPFRDFIKETSPEQDSGEGQHPAISVRTLAAVFGVWFHRAGWQEIAPKLKSVNPWVEIPCRDHAIARAMVRTNIRIGAMSHYPIMTGIEHPTWGLSWQTFPVAFWRPAGDWGFWRWLTREGERGRAHPALDKHSAYLGNALSTKLNPPPIPEFSSSLTSDGRLTMERILPIPAAAQWDEVGDAFDLLGSDANITVEGAQLRLHWSDCELVINWLGGGEPVWEPVNGGGRWVVRYDRAALAKIDKLTHRWELSLVSR